MSIALKRDEPILNVENLEVHYESNGETFRALRGVNLTVGKGEILALVGESGSGKSTLGYAIAGLLDNEATTSGEVVVGDSSVVDAAPAELRRLRRTEVGAVFQDPMSSLNPTMRISKQLTEAGGDLPVSKMLERVGLSGLEHIPRSYPHQLSGGQRQRLVIAMAMARSPKLVIADEPTTALDVTVQAQILRLFRKLCDELGTSFIFITHDLAVATSLADRVAVMYGGKIVESGHIKEVVASPAHPYTAALLDARFDIRTDKSHKLATLPGEPLAPTDVPVGCAFASRCLLSTSKCFQAVPPFSATDRHAGNTACWHSEDVKLGMWNQRLDEEDRNERTRQFAVKPESILRLTKADVIFPKSRGKQDVHALNGVSLDVKEGEAVAVVGESGSGKSTLLRVAAGLTRTRNVSQAYWPTHDSPQMVYQDAASSLAPWLRIFEVLEEPLREKMPSPQRRDYAKAILRDVGLPSYVGKLRPVQLSGGQRQRVAVARAIVSKPQLLLCDEPISAMDVSLAAVVLNLLGDLRERLQMAMIFVTHDIAAARYIADRILVMRNGSVVEEGPAEQLVTRPQHDYTRVLLSNMPGNLTRES